MSDAERRHYRYVMPTDGAQRLCGYRGWVEDRAGVELFLRGRFGDITDITLPMEEARALARWLLSQADDEGDTVQSSHD